MVTCVYICKIKEGSKDEFLTALQREKIESLFRAQEGCIYYHISVSTSDENCLILNDAWEDQVGYDGHISSDVCQVWNALEAQYTETGKSKLYLLHT